MMQLKFCPQGHTPSGWWLSERCPTCGGELGEPGTEEERAVSQKLEKNLAALERARGKKDNYFPPADLGIKKPFGLLENYEMVFTALDHPCRGSDVKDEDAG